MSRPVAGEPSYLQRYLTPLAPMLARGDVTDLYVNRPGEIWVETLAGAIERHDAPGLDDVALGTPRPANRRACRTRGSVASIPCCLPCLPDGARVQIVAPPATRGPLAMAIRKHVSADLTLERLCHATARSRAVRRDGSGQPGDLDRKLRTLLDAGDIAGLLAAAVVGRKTILVSGGTSTGKTTFLNALIREIPSEERLVLIEDTPELRLQHANAVGLLAARSALGEAQVSADDLLRASLRMRPDRIIVGELRGSEAYTFLRAINTGHPGIDDDGPCRQRRARGGADRVAGPADRHPARSRRCARLCAQHGRSSMSSFRAPAGTSPRQRDRACVGRPWRRYAAEICALIRAVDECVPVK